MIMKTVSIFITHFDDYERLIKRDFKCMCNVICSIKNDFSLQLYRLAANADLKPRSK